MNDNDNPLFLMILVETYFWIKKIMVPYFFEYFSISFFALTFCFCCLSSIWGGGNSCSIRAGDNNPNKNRCNSPKPERVRSCCEWFKCINTIFHYKQIILLIGRSLRAKKKCCVLLPKRGTRRLGKLQEQKHWRHPNMQSMSIKSL